MDNRTEKTSPAETRRGASIQNGSLAAFSEEITNLLIQEARRALEISPHDGLDWTLCLLTDAKKYDSIYPHTRGVQEQNLLNAAQKISQWNAIFYGNRQSAQDF